MGPSVRFALRSLRRSPGFALFAVAIVALGIGATTAMFSITYTVLAKPLAYREPDRLATLLFRVPQFSKEFSTIPVNAQHYLLWRDRARTLQEIGLVRPDSSLLSGLGQAANVKGARITANFFHLLGVQPILGRTFFEGEDQPGHSQVVIVSYQFWQQRLSGRADALGGKILLDGQPYEVVGVTGPSFPFPRGREISELERLPEQIDYWAPLVFSKDDLATALGNENYLPVARLKPGVTIAQVVDDLTALEKVFSKNYPEPVTFLIMARRLQQSMAREVRLPLLILMAAIVAVLLIVCINLMNLMTVRSLAQRRDWAIRLAIGAKVSDLLRSAFVESLVVALFGGAAGCVIAYWLLYAVRLKAPVDLPRLDELRLDPMALLFSLGASVTSAILFGLWPAWRASRVHPYEALQSSGRTASENRKGHRAGRFLVAGEVMLSTILLLGAGLLLKSFIAILAVDPGFNISHLLTVRINLPPDQYKRDADVATFYRRLLQQAKGLPGVLATGLVSDLPLTGENNNNPATAGDRPLPPIVQWPMTNYRYASSDYFETVGIPFKYGRTFQERATSSDEVIISENLAQRLWPGQSAIGRPIKLYGNGGAKTVIGVVGAVHAASLTDDIARMIYFPGGNAYARDMALVIRTGQQPEELASAVRRIVAGLDSQAAVVSSQSMQQIADVTLAPRRFQLILLLSFAAIALLLACMGIYGVLAFATRRRTAEIGVRMAFGARPAQILQSTLFSGMMPVIAGIAGGICISAAVSRLLQGLLFQVHALDPMTYALGSVVVLSVAALACLLPARRAAQLEPLDALRHE